eukprot:Opistho-1_new@70225
MTMSHPPHVHRRSSCCGDETLHERHTKALPPKTKVELHVHLDGSIRTETIMRVAKERGIHLPAKTVDELHKHVTVPKGCKSLTEFLSTFAHFIPVFRGSAEAIETIAYEFCEDRRREGIAYAEARYAPHLLADDKLSAEDVVRAINRGLERGQRDFDIIVRSLLCCMRHEPAWSMEVAKLCEKFAGEGVVGIDLAGDEFNFPAEPHAPAFDYAKAHGIRRTVHAGESGPASNVAQAIDLLHAERIGHGYHVIDDEGIYARVKALDVHLECCLTSSVCTCAVTAGWHCHPVVRFAADAANFSLSTDDPAVCNTTLKEEFSVATAKVGLDPGTLSRTVFNAARSSFLPEAEKAKLIADLLAEYIPKGLHASVGTLLEKGEP